MRIGIDALGYHDGYISLKRLIANTIDNLLLLDRENEYVIFLSRKHKHLKFPVPEGAKVKLLYFNIGRRAIIYNNLVRRLFIYPFYAHKEKIDVMIYQYYTPFLGRTKNIALLYDILYKDYPALFTWKEHVFLYPQKFLARMASGVLAISSAEKKRCLKYKYTTEKKIDYFLLACSPDFKPIEQHSENRIKHMREKYSLPEDFILFVGIHSARKNLDNLLRALPSITTPIKLVLTGEAKYVGVPSTHAQIVENLGIKSRVQYTGFIDDEDLCVLFACAKVFCFPSFAEGFGLPPLEAMASGVPVAVSNTTSLPEVCGEAGTYFDPHKPEEIANAVMKLLNDPQYYNEMRLKGLEQAKKFSWKKSAEKVLQFLTYVHNNYTH